MKTIATIIAFGIVLLSYSQNNYLAIYKDVNRDGVIMYPPGTKFELREANKELILDNNFEGVYTIKESVVLTVYPSWKNETDDFNLSTGRIEVLEAHTYKSKINTTSISSNGVTVEKELSNSSKLPNSKNVKLTFSNGVVFTYIDGQASATLNNTSLKIEGKYFVYSDLGVAKISFNSNTGTVWWVFEPIKH